jgi:hypothetical protein
VKRAARYALVLLAMSAVALASVVVSCARALAHRERAMRDEEASSTRLVTYLLRPGESLRVPVDPGTDVIRVVAHAFRRGSLGATGHLARWRVGSGASLETIAPGSTARASAEEPGVTIGDPVAFNLDARELAPELWLGLDAIAEADGMLLRVYRRETALGADQLRGDTLSFTKREHLAARSGELDWIDLPVDERAMLIGARWGKVAPLPTPGHPLQAVAISLSPPALRPSVPLAEAGSAVRGLLSPVAREAQHLQLSSTVQYDRIVPGRSAIVRALDAAVVLRVQVRRPFAGLEPKTAPLRMLVDITEDSRTVTSKVDADVRPSSQDVYEAAADGEVPSESTTFYALVPARGRIALRATVGALDVVLAELDPQASERRFVARRPTNWQVFEAREHGVLRLAHRAPSVAQPRLAGAQLMRVTRPHSVGVTKSHGLSFIPAPTAIPFESHAASQTFSLRLLAAQPTDVRVVVDGGQPRRRKSGVASAITTARVVHVNGESRITLAIGDDLEPGRHILSFQSSEVACSIHLPWARHARAEPEMAWVSGDLEP